MSTCLVATTVYSGLRGCPAEIHCPHADHTKPRKPRGPLQGLRESENPCRPPCASFSPAQMMEPCCFNTSLSRSMLVGHQQQRGTWCDHRDSFHHLNRSVHLEAVSLKLLLPDGRCFCNERQLLIKAAFEIGADVKVMRRALRDTKSFSFFLTCCFSVRPSP